MLLANERKLLIEYSQKMITSNLTTGTGGNISIYNKEENLVAVTPSGMDYFKVTPEDMVVTTLDGKIVDGKRNPTSELSFHLALQNLREDVNAVVHTHSVYAVTIATLNWELPPVHYLVGFSGDKVPLAPYATYGTKELADNIVNNIGHYNACLMANHGLVAVGKDVDTAYSVAEIIELVCRVYYQSKCIGEPVELNQEQMDDAMKHFGTYGNKQK